MGSPFDSDQLLEFQVNIFSNNRDRKCQSFRTPPGLKQYLDVNTSTFSSKTAELINSKLTMYCLICTPFYTGGLFHCNMLDKSFCHFWGDGSILCLSFYF